MVYSNGEGILASRDTGSSMVKINGKLNGKELTSYLSTVGSHISSQCIYKHTIRKHFTLEIAVLAHTTTTLLYVSTVFEYSSTVL